MLVKVSKREQSIKQKFIHNSVQETVRFSKKKSSLDLI